MPKTIPAADWDRMAAVAEFFGGVGSNLTYATRVDDDGRSYTPCCAIGMAEAAEVLPSADLADGAAYFGVTYQTFDIAIHDLRRELGLRPAKGSATTHWSDMPRVPFTAVMTRVGLVRGEGGR